VRFACVTVGYSLVVSSLFELGENIRLRFEVEPLALLLLGVGLEALLRRAARARAAASRSESTWPGMSWRGVMQRARSTSQHPS
jgi:hypothetical protein